LLLFRGKLAIGAKFAGKVLRVRRIFLLTSIILPGVVILVGIVGLGSGVVVIGTPELLLLELLLLFLLDEELEALLEEPLELGFNPEVFVQLDSISLKFQY